MSELGKLSTSELKILLSVFKNKRPETIKGAGIGEDCAALEGEGIMLLSTDPITARTNKIGELALLVATNDIYAGGGEPIAALVTLLIPPNVSNNEVQKVVNELSKTSDYLGIDVIGGHTEITDSVNRIVVSSTIIGKAKKYLNIKAIQKGDGVYVTKDLCIEGNIIMSDVKGVQSKYSTYDISVKNEANILTKYKNVIAMHDITEGGIEGAVDEIATNAGVGIIINYNKLPFDPTTITLTREFNINPLRLISSGSMLVIIRGDDKEILGEFLQKGKVITKIGEVTTYDSKIIFPDGRVEDTKTVKDEIYKI